MSRELKFQNLLDLFKACREIDEQMSTIEWAIKNLDSEGQGIRHPKYNFFRYLATGLGGRDEAFVASDCKDLRSHLEKFASELGVTQCCEYMFLLETGDGKVKCDDCEEEKDFDAWLEEENHLDPLEWDDLLELFKLVDKSLEEDISEEEKIQANLYFENLGYQNQDLENLADSVQALCAEIGIEECCSEMLLKADGFVDDAMSVRQIRCQFCGEEKTQDEWVK